MAEPRRIDDETTTPNVEERRPPTREKESRWASLHEDPVRNTQSEPILLPESGKIAYQASSADVELRDAEAQSEPRTAPAQPMSLFPDATVKDYRDSWSNIQTAFVDEPRKAVEEADELVESVLNKLSEVFARERQKLANQWERGDQVSTEDLRITLQRYRSFFDRLLNV
jgi:hypothetical protein